MSADHSSLGNHEPSSDRRELEQRNRELSILNAFARALNRSIDLEEALQVALVQAGELLGLDTGWVWLLNENNAESYLAAAQNLPPGLAERPDRMEGSCYCLDTYRSGDLNGAANVNVITCSRLKTLVDGIDGLRYHASIPLYASGKQLGILNLASKDWRELSPGDLRLLYTIGDLLSIAIERARLFTQRAEFGAVLERNRLAREIHDTLAQGLAAIAMQLEIADAVLGNELSEQKARQAVEQAMLLARSNLDEARRSVMNLRAAPLEGRTLGEALTELGNDNQESNSYSLDVEVVGDRPLPVRYEAGLYRIAQESLANVNKHAQAEHVHLSLVVTPEHITLTVSDDGLGFDSTDVTEGHFGLIGLNERARLLGGHLTIHSAPGEGSILQTQIPFADGQ